ncbi:DUF350 domain-containing protein [Vibrio coralliirubri]|uniref:DUF350 domain-containing protein n=1 Tax=Vibrio coralliirubri TaxID=1516159 RepID=UPI0022852AEB|nr:DUF350 domain-containing protein [Vibrio coralliirubri]MCY9861364.1 DUF350 domain-containing protein [Vibrio coralliirubri]
MNIPESYDLIASLNGFVPFLKYMGAAVAMLAFFVVAYMFATPHKEIALIKENNASAAISFAGAMVGYVTPLVTAMNVSENVIDFMLWGFLAAIVQIALFFSIRIVFPLMIKRIEKGEVAMGITVAALSVVIGTINSASMIP